jgi:hypothetical protein
MKDKYGVDFIQRDNVEFSDEEVFGDKDVHEFNCDCYDGVAFCYERNTSKVLPDLIVEYPKREDVMQDKMLCDCILKYCGLYDLGYEDINYGDIMLALGKINKKQKLC